jgi:hypothetical protein
LALAEHLVQADQILYLVQLRLQAEVMDLIPHQLLADQAAAMVRVAAMEPLERQGKVIVEEIVLRVLEAAEVAVQVLLEYQEYLQLLVVVGQE